MAREPIKTDPDGLAEIWRAAEQRRTEDIGGWICQLLERRRLRLADDGAKSARAHPGPAITSRA